jgi:hypothetical protein
MNESRPSALVIDILKPHRTEAVRLHFWLKAKTQFAEKTPRFYGAMKKERRINGNQ